jgi:hypothetical protein
MTISSLGIPVRSPQNKYDQLIALARSTPMRAAQSPRCRRPEAAMDTILVVNAGSSSVKFQVFATDGTDKLDRLIKGQIDGIATRPRLRARGADGALLIDQSYTAGEVSDPRAAIEVGGAWLRKSQKLVPIAV